MLLRKMNLVLAPEDVPGGGGVTGPDETPAGGVNDSPDTGSPEPLASPDAGGDDPSPFAGRQESSEGRGRPGGGDNPIPYSRVRQMLSRATKEAEARAEARFKQQMEPILSQLHPDAIRAGIAESMLTSLGYQPKKPEPKLVTQEEFERTLKARDQQYQSDLMRQQEETQASRDIEAAKQVNKDLFEAYPDLEEDCANLWASPWALQNKVSMKQIVEHKVKTLRAAIGKFNATYAAEKDRDQEVPVPMRPGAGAAPRQGKKHALGTDEGAAAAALELLGKAGVR